MLIRSSGNRDWRLFFFSDHKILLNGDPVMDVIEADDIAGYVIRYCRDESGRLIADRGRYKTDRVEGTVVFTGTRRFNPDDAKAAAQAKRDRRAARNLRIAAAQGGVR